jgi:hypothetical protein
VFIMKTFNHKRLLGLALTGGLSLLGAQSAFAAAGDSISNTATLNYSVGGAAQTLIESSDTGNSTPGTGNGTATTFLEDRVINFTVTRGGATGTAVPNGTLQAVQYTITNNGNGSQGFLLKGLNNADGTADPFGGNADSWDATPGTIQTFVEDGTTAGFQPAEDTAAYVATLAAGSSVDVYVVSTIPLVDSSSNPLATGDVAVMSLLAQVAIPGSTGIAADAITTDDNGNESTGGTGFTNGAENVADATGTGVAIPDDPATEQTVFNDPAGTLDVAQDAQNSDDSSYTIQTANLTVTKTSAALWDFVNQANNPKSIPGGSVVRYTITVANAAGAADATLTTISDTLALPVDTQFGDGTNANAALSGANNVRITDGAGTVAFCNADGNNADGCINNGGVGGTDLVVDLSLVGGGITDVLQAGQTLTIEFDTTL